MPLFMLNRYMFSKHQRHNFWVILPNPGFEFTWSRLWHLQIKQENLGQ